MKATSMNVVERLKELGWEKVTNSTGNVYVVSKGDEVAIFRAEKGKLYRRFATMTKVEWEEI